MPPQYEIRVYGTDGALNAIMNRFRVADIQHTVDVPSTMQLSFYGLEPLRVHFVTDAIVVLRRKVAEASLDWYTEYVGFHRTPQKQITTDNNRIFTSYSRGLLDLIKRRSIRYYSDTVGSAKGPGAADDVIKEYVEENAGALSLVTNGRVVDGVTPGLDVAPDLSEGPIWSGAHAWDNLLDAITSIGDPLNVDFDVVWGGLDSPTTFTFTTYYPQQGTDRREGTANPFTFSPEMGNMSNPNYTESRTEEITSALVLGPGEDTLRDTTLRTSPETTASPWNVVEEDIDASNTDTEAGLNAVGDGLLHDKRAAISFNFDVIQTPKSTYGKDYFLGDIVTARFDDVSTGVQIKGVHLNLAPGSGESISLTLEQVHE